MKTIEDVKTVCLTVIGTYSRDLQGDALCANRDLLLQVKAKREAWVDLAKMLEIPQEDIMAARLGKVVPQ